MGTDDFPSPCGDKDRKFEPARGNALLLAQRDHEGTDFGIWQRRMVLDPADLRFLGQQLVEMPAPACRVLTVTVAAGCCPIEDHLDAAAHAARGLRLLSPN